MERRAVVVGGGLAGIAAAVMLADHGVAVTLLEARRRLGGRAGSFEDPRTGEVLDNCQHVAMGACRVYVQLLERLGVAHMMAWGTRQTWIERGGRRSTLRAAPLPGTWAYAPSLALARFLSMGDKASIARAVRAARDVNRVSLRDVVFLEWLEATSPTPRAIARFWEPLIVSACNLSPARVSAEVGLHVVQGALLGGARDARIGVPTAPLSSLYEPVGKVLEAAGGRVVHGARVIGIEPGRVMCADGAVYACVAVVCALDPASANRLVTIDGGHPYAGVSFSPILGVHVRYDRPVLDVPHAVLVEGGVQWVFAKAGDPCMVHAVASAADAWVGLGEKEIVERVVAEIGEYLPIARGASVRWARPVLERRATFAATPDFQGSRPGAGRYADQGCFLAGDATATGWPATMEGAVRSGRGAAGAALLSLGEISGATDRPER
ncbi:MAG: hydroxysqualene dehydroxylase HpnE [Phycisphaeraceae bacterium]|nr:hydroxysqualene dehydroxylase HpnE [Phycisphaeraceae bacterium]